MINITRNKERFARQQILQEQKLEIQMQRRVNSVLRQTYLETAEIIKHGDPLNIVPTIVNRYTNTMRSVYVNHYRNIGDFNFKAVTNRLQELKPKKTADYYHKDAQNSFWFFFERWVQQQSLEKVAKVNSTTRNLLSAIVRKGVRESLSYVEIAKEIQKKTGFTRNRAATIAITETHTAFNKSIYDSIEQNNVFMETKEWLNAGDERVRVEPFNHFIAHGEKVGMHEKFVKTGEPLQFPGDWQGSAANIIRCRCVVLYNTEVTQIG